MSGTNTAQVARAKRLLALEGDAGTSSAGCAAAAWSLYEKLNARLAPLLGAAGVQALFVRSAKLAQADFPSLAEVATPDGLKKLGAGLQALEPADATSDGTQGDHEMNDSVSIRNLPSRVPGLDDVLGGGIPEFSFNLNAGGA